MAQLPPKVPSHAMWPSSSPFQKLPSMASFSTTNAANNNSNNNSWVDEFLDFSALRRGAHRRSVSDSVTFLEAPPPADDDDDQFDRMNDETFMSLLNVDDLVNAPNSPNSDPDSGLLINNDKNKCEENYEEGQKCKAESNVAHKQEEVEDVKPEPLDPKRVKRILANRQSAQRSRVRKLQYISELERSVTTLQTEVSALSPRVAFLDHQRSVLTVGNSHLKQRIAALAQDRIFKDAHQEALKKELERLRSVYNQQNQNSSTSD